MTTTDPTTRAWRQGLDRVLASDSFALWLCLLCFIVLAVIAPGFASAENQVNLLIAALPLLILAIGQTVVLISGGIDLSATAVIGFTSVVGAMVMGGDHGWLRGSPVASIAAILAMLVAGAAAGCLNGVCVAWLRMPAFMVTLTSLTFLQGAAVWMIRKVAGTETLYNLSPAFLSLGRGLVVPGAIAAACAIAVHLMLRRTLPGWWLRAAGTNPRASLISGVPVAAITVAAYALSGLLAAVTSILITSRLETASPSHGKSLLLDVIGAAVIGGTSLSGGKGSVAWTVCGVLFLSMLGNGLNLLNLSDFLTMLVKGNVILLAALLDRWRSVASRQVPASNTSVA